MKVLIDADYAEVESENGRFTDGFRVTCTMGIP
jgi:hypothetical protein